MAVLWSNQFRLVWFGTRLILVNARQVSPSHSAVDTKRILVVGVALPNFTFCLTLSGSELVDKIFWKLLRINGVLRPPACNTHISFRME